MELPPSVIYQINREQENLTVILDNGPFPQIKSNINELKSLIQNLYSKYNGKYDNDSKQIKRVLDSLKGVLGDSEFLNISGDNLYGLFNPDEEMNSEEAISDLRKIREQVINTNLSYDVLGSYTHKTRTITIYRNDEVLFNEVLAHELFHFVHHVCLDFNHSKEKNNKYYRRVVFESLATFFQYALFSFCKPFTDTIKRSSPIFFPYSGAKYLNEKTFLTTFQKSLYDFEDALKVFIPKNEAEIILSINKKEPRYYKKAQVKSHFYIVDDFIFKSLPHSSELQVECKTNLEDLIKPKDILFHSRYGEIKSVSVVKSINKLNSNSHLINRYEIDAITINIDRPVFFNGWQRDEIMVITRQIASKIIHDILKSNQSSSIELLN